MTLQNKLKEAFLIFDRNGMGTLDKSSALTALHSVGLVLNSETQSKIDAMNMNEFITFGEELAKANTPEKCIQDIITNLTANKKTISVKDFEHVASAISCINAADLKAFLAVVNPNDASVVNPANLLAQLSN